MKKLILTAVVLGGIATLSSCKKDHVCSCSGQVFSVPFSDVDTTYSNISKKDAKAKCDANDFTFGSDYIDCELK